MKIQLAARLLSAALLGAALAACSFDERIADHAVKYNKTVEEANNSLLLLNILRARDRRPMHFTALSIVRGEFSHKTTGSIGLDYPFGNDASDLFKLTPSLSLSQTTSPSFDVAILNKKEFISGILSPIEKSTFKFYLDQRWPPEILLHLLVHKVTVSMGSWTKSKDYAAGSLIRADGFIWLAKDGGMSGDKEPTWSDGIEIGIKDHEIAWISYDEKWALRKITWVANETFDRGKTIFANGLVWQSSGGGVSGDKEPDWPAGPGAIVEDGAIIWLAKPELLNSPSPDPDRDFNFRIFQAWVEHIRERVSFVTAETGRAIGPELSKPKGTLDSAILNQLIATEKAELRLVAVPEPESGEVRAYRLCKFESSLMLCIGQCPKRDPESMCRDADGTGIAEKLGLLQVQGSDAPAGKFKQPTFGLQLRSVQGIMYYLGELLRYQRESEQTVFAKDKRVLFKLTEDKAFAEEPFVSTTYEDKTYYLEEPPDGMESRAGSVLALVSQLFGLHKRSEELPTTTTIKTVGDGS